MPLLPFAARFASFAFLCATLQLSAQTTTTLGAPTKPSPDLHSTVRNVPVPVDTGETPELKLVARFDANDDLRLDPAERKAALAYLAEHPPTEAPPQSGRPAPAPPTIAAFESVKRGRSLTPDKVDQFPGEALYGTKKIRTFFLTFEEDDWEKELTAFARTDVQVPARLQVDGKILNGVGVHLRPLGQGEVLPAGYKRTLRLSLDYTQAGQQLAGHRRLELLASTSDPTFLHTLLYHRICQDYLAAPSDSLARVVINGEDWGIYDNMEPLDEAFTFKKFSAKSGALWTAGPGATLKYLGDDPAAYRAFYRLESPENPAAWAKLIQLCKILGKPPTDESGSDLAAILDIDSTLRFLALQNAVINQDGYGGTTGSYGLYLAGDGRFRLIPLEAERSFALIQVTEYTEHAPPAGPAPKSHRTGNAATPPAGKTDSRAEKDAALLRPYLHPDYPKQGNTNLAMLLSYSLVAKADRNDDEKVTAEEWHAFAGSWFVVMDDDSVGRVTRAQFIAKVRLLVTPPSVIDGRTTQTFGREDAAAEIGGDFLKDMDRDHDGYIDREEMTAAFDRWFVKWAGGKPAVLTQPALQIGLSALFSKSVFVADQTYIPNSSSKTAGKEDDRGGKHGGGHGQRGEGGGGSGLNLGPIHLGVPKTGGGENSARLVTTYGTQLDPFDGESDATKPLLANMLSAPHWRSRYLGYLGQIADDWLLWSKLGPVAKEYHDSIADEVRQEAHQPFSYERFVQELDQEAASPDETPSLKSFAATRRTYLLRNGADGEL